MQRSAADAQVSTGGTTHSRIQTGVKVWGGREGAEDGDHLGEEAVSELQKLLLHPRNIHVQSPPQQQPAPAADEGKPLARGREGRKQGRKGGTGGGGGAGRREETRRKPNVRLKIQLRPVGRASTILARRTGCQPTTQVQTQEKEW